MGKFKVGDTVRYIHIGSLLNNSLAVIKDTSGMPECMYLISFKSSGVSVWVHAHKLSLDIKIEPPEELLVTKAMVDAKATSKVTSDGGPAEYYDFPSDWTTFNDFLESKSVNQWKGYSFHLGNIGKAICRWGDKDGTTETYDAKKIIYSGCRVLKMMVGTEKLREYLQSLLNDEQFKVKGEK